MTDRSASTPPRPARPTPSPASAFRLNLEQQKNRARELLRAARAGDVQALARFEAVPPRSSTRTEPKLADAQFVIARELRFASWARLKAHIAAMERQRAAMESAQAAPDGELKTLHLRCGSDIRDTLREAGFVGDFLEHSTPYCQGPVVMGPERHSLMARFIVEGFGDFHSGLTYEGVLESERQNELALWRSVDEYERVVLWLEHDPYDQLALARLLAHYANAPRPQVLELVSLDEFPGGARFLGLGQLPPEALRLLWLTRKPITDAQLARGDEVWNALASNDPGALAALMRAGIPELPLMARALRRHLQELPSVTNGLGLCQQIFLDLVGAQPSISLNEVAWRALRERDPLPSIGDWGIARVLKEMEAAAEPPLVRTPNATDEPIWRHRLTLTDAGWSLLRGERDWSDMHPVPRWVGGVQIRGGGPWWRWDDARREPVKE